MKKLVIIVIAIFGLGVFNLSAQATKFGHVDYKKVLDSLPSKIAADKDMQSFMESGQATVAEMQKALEEAYMKHQEAAKTQSDILNEIGEKNLMEQQQLLQMKQQSLEQDLQIMNDRLYAPIESNLALAVKTVAKKHKLNYVLEVNSLLFVDGGLDLTNEIKAEVLKLETARLNK